MPSCRLRSCFLPVVLAVLLLGGGTACGQSDEEASRAATHSEWAVGGQVLPVAGVSVRWAPTSRVTLQTAAFPGLGGDFQGTVGARVLYKFVRKEGYNVYGSVGVAPFFSRTLQLTDDLSVREETEAIWFVTGTIGAEAALGDHFGLSAEAGADELSIQPDRG